MCICQSYRPCILALHQQGNQWIVFSMHSMCTALLDIPYLGKIYHCILLLFISVLIFHQRILKEYKKKMYLMWSINIATLLLIIHVQINLPSGNATLWDIYLFTLFLQVFFITLTSGSDSELASFFTKRVTRDGEGKVSPSLFLKIGKSTLIWGSNTLIVVNYG